jgi:type VI secretion system secreted protein Hcp
MATIGYFLRIDGVQGESADARHQGWIDAESWSWGETHPGPGGPPGAGAGAGAGRVQVHDLHVVAHFGRASPRLLVACASREHFRQAELAAVRTGGAQQEFLTLTLSDVVVTAYQTGGSAVGGLAPTDQLALGFGKIVVEYRPQKADGSLAAPVKGGWDVRANRKA